MKKPNQAANFSRLLSFLLCTLQILPGSRIAHADTLLNPLYQQTPQVSPSQTESSSGAQVQTTQPNEDFLSGSPLQNPTPEKTELPEPRRLFALDNGTVTEGLKKTHTGYGFIFDTKVNRGWSAGVLVYDDWGTPAKESISLSGYSNLTFGLKGDASRIKLELTDVQGKRAAAYIDGIQAAAEKVFSVSTTVFTGIDMSRITEVGFVVEADFRSGVLEISMRDKVYSPASAPASAGRGLATVLNQDSLTVDLLSFPAQLYSEKTTSGFKIAYPAPYEGWAGGGYSFRTPGSKDLISGDELILGLKASAERIKLELKTDTGETYVHYLTGVRENSENFYRIPLTAIPASVRDRIKSIFFIAENVFRPGLIEVWLPTKVNLAEVGKAALTDANKGLVNLPVPNGLSIKTSPNDNAGEITKNGDVVKIGLATKQFGYSGDGILSYSAPVDLSAMSHLVFGISGQVNAFEGGVKQPLVMTVTDALGKKAYAALPEVSNAEQLISFPVKNLTYSIDVTKVVSIAFGASGYNISGSEVNVRIKSSASQTPVVNPQPPVVTAAAISVPNGYRVAPSNPNYAIGTELNGPSMRAFAVNLTTGVKTELGSVTTNRAAVSVIDVSPNGTAAVLTYSGFGGASSSVTIREIGGIREYSIDGAYESVSFREGNAAVRTNLTTETVDLSTFQRAKTPIPVGYRVAPSNPNYAIGTESNGASRVVNVINLTTGVKTQLGSVSTDSPAATVQVDLVDVSPDGSVAFLPYLGADAASSGVIVRPINGNLEYRVPGAYQVVLFMEGKAIVLTDRTSETVNLSPFWIADMELPQFLKTLDRNSDAQLDAGEVFEMLGVIKSRIDQKLPSGDLNRDGSTNADDSAALGALYTRLAENTPYSANSVLRREAFISLRLFVRLDMNKDYALTASEVIGLKSLEEEIRSALTPGTLYRNELDLNGDGALTGADLQIISDLRRAAPASYAAFPLSSEVRQQLRVFSLVDTNGDMNLTAEEVSPGLSRAAERIITALNGGTANLNMDLNGDGTVAPADALLLINMKNSLISSGQMALPMSRDELMRLKMRVLLDSNQDGALTAQEIIFELRSSMTLIREAVRDSKYVPKLDFNGDGRVDSADLAVLTGTHTGLRSNVDMWKFNLSPMEWANLRAYFLADINNDLLLTRDEITAARNRLSTLVMRRMYDARCDFDGNRTVSTGDQAILNAVTAYRQGR
ncbi:MAG: hypothetical protein FGM27_02400 [Candidatus Omnitrophica bacterium]|nr:hypothetical protein [Candidatus Omnitrophota bacterium]